MITFCTDYRIYPKDKIRDTRNFICLRHHIDLLLSIPWESHFEIIYDRKIGFWTFGVKIIRKLIRKRKIMGIFPETDESGNGKGED